MALEQFHREVKIFDRLLMDSTRKKIFRHHHFHRCCRSLLTKCRRFEDQKYTVVNLREKIRCAGEACCLELRLNRVNTKPLCLIYLAICARLHVVCEIPRLRKQHRFEEN